MSNSDVCWVLIHRREYKFLISDVLLEGRNLRYIGTVLIWPIPMYFLFGIGPSYIGMASECRFPMYVIIGFIVNTSEARKNRQSRCIFPSKSIKLSNSSNFIRPPKLPKIKIEINTQKYPVNIAYTNTDFFCYTFI